MPDSPNYPDILGLITGGDRCNIGMAQVAVAVRPRLVRAGRPFEVILLVQNAADSVIDVSMALQLPSVDAHRKPDRFIGKTQRLVVEVKAAEVGYVMLPVTTLPDTAISDDYKIGVEIEVRTPGKANRIRSNEGGGAVDTDFLSDETKTAIDALRIVNFSTEKRRGRGIIDVGLTVMSGTVGKIPDLTPGWVSVCKVSDYQDDRLLLERYGTLVQVNTLPRLKRQLLLQPLIETTESRFKAAGFPLKEAEATAIAKLMTLVLEYATPRVTAHGAIVARGYDVEGLLGRDSFEQDKPPVLPHWFRGMLGTIEIDARAATHPAQVITRYLYDDLLRDAVDLGFDLITEATGENFGSSEEQDAYREQLIDLLKAKNGLDFNRVYLPLVMGGILISDQIAIAKENPAELLNAIGMTLEDRFEKLSADEQPIYTMANRIHRAGGAALWFLR